ncbi:MAG: helix-turn-helix transcriptional regulator [Anaerolinea sp.]|nr:helix-turn-helix transcriptional regulator [Anaerolinea sp.]
MSTKLQNRLFELLSDKERREKRRITQSEVAEAVDVSLHTIIRWMRNDVTKFEAPIVERLCDYFGCEVGDLLYLVRDGSETPPAP